MSSRTPLNPGVRPLMLGMGWFPDQENGVNRYFRSLLDALGRPPAVVIGPATDAPPSVCAVERHDRSALRRVVKFTRAALARAANADVVDTHFVMYAFLPLVLGLRGRPLVVHFQGPWGAEAVSEGRPTDPRELVRWTIERVVYRRARTVIVLSGAFKDLAVRRYGVRPDRIRIVRPGVDLDRFSPGDRGEARIELGLPLDRPVAVAARRLVPRMGMDVLLDAWAEVVAAGEGSARPLLVVVGDGQLRPELEAQARRLGIDGDVRFAGKVTDDALVAAYRAADVVVTPSVSLEGFGLVTLEALACGVPVVASAVEGLKEALEGLDPGLLVEPSDPQALAARLLGVLEGHDPAPSRERCREYAEGFTWERTASEIREIYRAAAFPDDRAATGAR